MSATVFPICSDARPCMFKMKFKTKYGMSRCTILMESYDGEKRRCPFYKPREEAKP